ncbi:FAD-dependent oxidoreductase [Paramuricea clavata]|uniref:FAD-dependent oxidoreductase n=1 Tax=Paramuricea clavata TaxID=317549 RepID=A0A7D9JLP4_PARCT|nr:FAD-dependent oxidoreductase [Paramuricea clavata]
MGLTSAYECPVKEGKKVLFLERFSEFANVHSSSVGYSRQFRVSYSEKNLSDLALKTYVMWENLKKEMNDDSLVQLTGCLWFGDASVESSEGNIDLAIQNLKALGEIEGKDYRVLEGKEAIMNSTEFAFISRAVVEIDNPEALFTVKGGTINVPGLVYHYVEALKIPNAMLINNARVTKIDYSNEEYVEVKVVVDGNEETYRGNKIILTSGAYVNEVFCTVHPPVDFRINLIIYLWCSTYFAEKHKPLPSGTDLATWPIWYFFGPKPKDDSTEASKDHNDYYGFPSEPERPQYLRVAPACTSQKEFDFMLFPPEINKRPLDKNALKFTSNFVDKFMPDLDPSLKEKEESTCVAGFAQLNENVHEKDEGAGFVIDFLLPESKLIVVFTGGWAMKFVPMIGKILTDLAIRGKNRVPRPHRANEYQTRSIGRRT